MMRDMPEEVFMKDGEVFNASKHGFKDSATSHTLTSHHEAEIAKRDRAIEVLESVGICINLETVHNAIDKAVSILNGDDDE